LNHREEEDSSEEIGQKYCREIDESMLENAVSFLT
jgi:hypothetical protein